LAGIKGTWIQIPDLAVPFVYEALHPGFDFVCFPAYLVSAET